MASGLLNFLFQGTPPSSVTSTITDSSSQIPLWLQEYERAAAAKATALANEPYQKYPGPRVSGFTPTQQQAFQGVQNVQGSFQPYINQAKGLATQGSQNFDQSQLNPFLSPYVGGVLNREAQLAGRNLTENLLPGVNDTFTGSGQFGSSRHADFTNRALRDTQEALLGQQANTLQQSYNDAFQNYNLQQNRALQGASQLAGLGQQQQQQSYQDLAALQGVGETQQRQNQLNLDTAYNDFQNQVQYPEQQLGFLSNILRGIPYSTQSQQSTTSTGTNNLGSPSPLSQILGAGSLLAGLFGGHKKGGLIKKAKGGMLSFATGGDVGDDSDDDSDLEQTAQSDDVVTYGDVLNPEDGTNEPQGSQKLGDQEDSALSLSGLQRINDIESQRRLGAAEELRQARERVAQQYANPKLDQQQLFLRAAAGFLQPTRTGSFGESLGNVAQDIAPVYDERSRLMRAYQQQLANADLANAQLQYKLSAAPGKILNVGGPRGGKIAVYDSPGVGLVPVGDEIIRGNVGKITTDYIATPDGRGKQQWVLDENKNPIRPLGGVIPIGKSRSGTESPESKLDRAKKTELYKAQINSLRKNAEDESKKLPGYDSTLDQLDQLESALNKAGGSNFGIGGENFNSIATALNIDPSQVNNATYLKNTAGKLALSLKPEGVSRLTNLDVGYLVDAVPHLGSNKQVNQMIIDGLRSLLEKQKKYAQGVQEALYKGYVPGSPEYESLAGNVYRDGFLTPEQRNLFNRLHGEKVENSLPQETAPAIQQNIVPQNNTQVTPSGY